MVNQIIAGAATFSVCLLLWVLSWVSSYNDAGWAKAIAYCSILTHFEPFSKGIIDTKDLVFYFLGHLPWTLPDRPISRISAVEGIMANEWIKARQTRYGAFVSLYTVVIIAVLVAANWLANDHNKTVDVTANKQFTLSDETKKVAGGLKHPITFYYFDKSDSYDRARDMLDRYKNLSSNIKVSTSIPIRSPMSPASKACATSATSSSITAKRKKPPRLLPKRNSPALWSAKSRAARAPPASSRVRASTPSTIPDREGYSSLKDVLEKNNYKTQSISLIQKPADPQDLQHRGHRRPEERLPSARHRRHRTYVNGGGRAIFNFDPVLNMPHGKTGRHTDALPPSSPIGA